MRIIDLTGQRFGRLTVIERNGTKGHEPTWLCRCDCGKEKIVIGAELRKGNTNSCGCYAKEIAKQTSKTYIAGKNKTHGRAGTLIYKEWSEMKRRCLNEHDTSYNNYGGRGIKVCERWVESFSAFYDDVSALPHFGEKGYTLNRIDNNGNYELNNVEWADAMTQANNRRTNILVEYNGNTYTLADISRTYNIPYKKLHKRYRILKWTIEKAISTP